jgi:hypothetical protein
LNGYGATGIVLTMFGRRRPIPDMASRNPNARGFAERTAVNTPLQGTAADLIKLAMIRIDALLSGERARMLLQVHDELLFWKRRPKTPRRIAALVKHEMETVAGARCAAGGGRRASAKTGATRSNRERPGIGQRGRTSAGRSAGSMRRRNSQPGPQQTRPGRPSP